MLHCFNWHAKSQCHRFAEVQIKQKEEPITDTKFDDEIEASQLKTRKYLRRPYYLYDNQVSDLEMTGIPWPRK